MKECLIRNLADGSRDYPLKNGESIYLGAKGSSTAIARVHYDNISTALRTAEDKGRILIEEIPDMEEEEASA